MRSRTFVSRLLLAVFTATMAVALTAGVASAQGVDPFQPKPTVTGTAGTGTVTSGSTSSGTAAGSGAATGSASPPSATASPQAATTAPGSGLPMTGSHTLGTFWLGVAAILLGFPLVRAGRRRWDARHWPAC